MRTIFEVFSKPLFGLSRKSRYAEWTLSETRVRLTASIRLLVHIANALPVEQQAYKFILSIIASAFAHSS